MAPVIDAWNLPARPLARLICLFRLMLPGRGGADCRVGFGNDPAELVVIAGCTPAISPSIWLYPVTFIDRLRQANLVLGGTCR